MRRLAVVAALIASALFLAAVHFSWHYYRDTGHADAPRIEIKVPPGTTLMQARDELVEQGVLGSPRLFRWAAWLTRREGNIKAGRYLFRRGESVARILEKLVRGEVDYWRVVVPEGLHLVEIASILQRRAEIDSTEFMAVARDSVFAAELGIPAPTLEGYLFPDTYLLSWPLTPEGAARRMVRRFHDACRPTLAMAADSIGMPLHDLVTLASVIQAEAVFEAEMPRISAVFHNRLRVGMRLEADPTVAYALGGVRRRLLLRDLRVDSPYNTYRVRGLPPGPICSPGRAALLAAAAPLPDTGEFYFVADGTGGHHFSRTYQEHLQAKHRIRYARPPAPAPEEPLEQELPSDEAGKSEGALDEAGNGAGGGRNDSSGSEGAPGGAENASFDPGGGAAERPPH